MKNTILTVILLTVSVLMTASFPLSARAAWGDRDLAFGFWGVYTDNCSSNCTPTDAALQSDGKILVTGSREVGGKRRFFLRRYLSNGAPDANFGNDGFATSNALININSNYSGSSIAIQPNGKIVVAGTIDDSAGGTGIKIAIWRFNSNGSSDSTFGAYGMRTYPESFWSLISLDVAVQDGKLIIGFTNNYTAGIYRGEIIRLNSNGLADTTFGNNGKVTHSSTTIIRKVLVEEDTSKIVFASEVASPSMLTRKLPDGADDSSFQMWNNDLGGVAGLVRLSDGKYLAAATDGDIIGSNSRRFAVKFSADGIKEAQSPTYEITNGNQFNFLGAQQDGKVIVGSPNGFYRFNSSLSKYSLETYTGSNLPSMGQKPYEKQVLLQPDDKMIIISKSSTGRIVLTRILSN